LIPAFAGITIDRGSLKGCAMADEILLASARPTLEVNGRAQPQLAGRLLALQIDERLDAPARCEMVCSNWGETKTGTGFLYFDRRTLDFGKALKVKVADGLLFDGEIVALQAEFPAGQAARLRVVAEDRLHRLRVRHASRTFVEVSDADVVRGIANAYALSAAVDTSGPIRDLIAQIGASDLHLLQERVAAMNGCFWLEGSRLLVRPRANPARGTSSLRVGTDLRDFTVAADARTVPTRVRATGWDVDGKDTMSAEAAAPALGTEAAAGISGLAIREQAFGARTDLRLFHFPDSHEEADNLARNGLKNSARQFVTGHGVATTSAQLRPGSLVSIADAGALFSGEYRIVSAHHRFDAQAGMRSLIEVARSGIGKNT
jgi:phage protein D